MGLGSSTFRGLFKRKFANLIHFLLVSILHLLQHYFSALPYLLRYVSARFATFSGVSPGAANHDNTASTRVQANT